MPISAHRTSIPPKLRQLWIVCSFIQLKATPTGTTCRRSGDWAGRPDGVHRGWIHPLHDRAVDVFRPLLTPVHWGVFVTAATPWECARTLRFRPAQSIPRSPSQSGRFFAIHLLQTLKKAALNAYFCLFAIWPVLCPFQPDFRSYFAPRLCICTNLDLTLMTLKSAYKHPSIDGRPGSDSPPSLFTPGACRTAQTTVPRGETGKDVAGRPRDNIRRHTDTVHRLAVGPA